jgi:hypothetical protein
MDVERRMELIVKKQGNTFTVNLGVRSNDLDQQQEDRHRYLYVALF